MSSKPTENVEATTDMGREQEAASDSSSTVAESAHDEKDKDAVASRGGDSAAAEEAEAPHPVPEGPISVPRSQRRGLWARLSLIPEVEKPTEYKNSQKWIMTVIVALAAATGSTGSSIFYRECPEIAE